MISENLKKTIIGIIAGLMAAGVALGYFTPEQAAEAKEATTGLLENIGGLILASVSIWGIFTGKKE